MCCMLILPVLFPFHFLDIGLTITSNMKDCFVDSIEGNVISRTVTLLYLRGFRIERTRPAGATSHQLHTITSSGAVRLIYSQTNTMLILIFTFVLARLFCFMLAQRQNVHSMFMQHGSHIY